MARLRISPDSEAVMRVRKNRPDPFTAALLLPPSFSSLLLMPPLWAWHPEVINNRWE
jgi:hypothetical protein